VKPLFESRDMVFVGHGPALVFDPIVLGMGAALRISGIMERDFRLFYSLGKTRRRATRRSTVYQPDSVMLRSHATARQYLPEEPMSEEPKVVSVDPDSPSQVNKLPSSQPSEKELLEIQKLRTDIQIAKFNRWAQFFTPLSVVASAIAVLVLFQQPQI